MFDSNSLLIDGSSAKSAAYNSPWYDTTAGLPFEGVPLRVEIRDGSTASGTANLTITVENSADASAVNQTIATFPALAIGTAGIAFPNYEEILRITTRAGFPYVRVKIATAGTFTTLAYTPTAGFVLGDIP